MEAAANNEEAAMEESGDEEGEFSFEFMAAQIQNNLAMAAALVADDESVAVDHRTLPRKARTKCDAAGALACIKRDHTGPQPLFEGREFETMFRVSRRRFEALLQDVGNSGDSFFLTTQDTHKRPAASLEARLLLPLKTLACGVPPHCFRDHFSMSQNLARDCCFEFDRTMKELCEVEYLRLPTCRDLQQIEKLHRKTHRVPGMHGSLDCMHTHWKNCPKAWQGQCKGKEKKSTIILEGVCDCNLWMWSVSCGCAGTLNDLNVLNLSPFLEALVSGRFTELEKKAGVVPHEILEGDVFEQMFITVDGIYPQCSRFVKGFSHPVSQVERTHTGWQESVRKDIERAFGVMQSMFQWISRPILLHQLTHIADRARTCIMLHNMCVSDRIMEGEVRRRHDPAFNIMEVEDHVVPMPPDLEEMQQRLCCGTTASSIGVRNMPDCMRKTCTRRKEWQDLTNIDQHHGLHTSLKHCVSALPKKN